MSILSSTTVDRGYEGASVGGFCLTLTRCFATGKAVAGSLFNGQFGRTRVWIWLGRHTFAAGSPWYSNVTSPQRQLPLAIAIDQGIRRDSNWDD